MSLTRYLLLLLFAFNAQATTYYASPTGDSGNTGLSDQSPWTLIHALTNISDNDTIILMDGVYDSSGTAFGFLLNGFDGVTIQASNKWQSVVTGSPDVGLSANGYTGEGGVYLAENCIFDGICASNNAKGGFGVSRGCTLRNCWATHNGNDWSMSGIYAVAAIATNNTIEYCLSEYNGGTNGSGLYLSGPGNTVRGNVFRHNAAFGFQLYTEVVNLTNNNNHIYNNLTYGNTNAYYVNGFGAEVWSANGADGSCPGTNYVYGNTFADGLHLSYGGCYITNNIILPSPNDTSSGIILSVIRPPFVLANYNLGTNSFGDAAGASDVITNYAGIAFISPTAGRYFIGALSAAKNAADSDIFGPVDFFGNAQTSVSDIGAFQYHVGLTGPTPVLDPSGNDGANYWGESLDLALPLLRVGTMRSAP